MCRLVRAVLGEVTIAADKLECGSSLTVLGAKTTVRLTGVTSAPDQKKREKWIRRIEEALRVNRLTSGEASKLSGALQWATQRMFRRLGRALLRPIYK